MKYISRKHMLRGIPTRWAQQYMGRSDKEQAEKTKKLLNLTPSECTQDKISEIIGNRSWVTLTCMECDGDVPALIEFEKTYSEEKYRVCQSCLERAIRFLVGEHDHEHF